MSEDGFTSFLPPIETATTGTPLTMAEVVAQRINGDHIASAAISDIQQPILNGLRRISPDSGPEGLTFSVSPAPEKTPTILDRIASFFASKDDHPSEPPLVRFARPPEQKEQPATQGHDLTETIDRLEKSQQFATGMTLLSSLTQSVMSSSKRLTQGQ
ncbi:hypothetical protein [Ensifer aridi]|uniref:hypothetical protein n=1 Tax=Ensifer aridi TaxID=1708715 RepID=UPI00358E74D5